MSITSINLSTLPFMGSCDSTRAQMASKQINQALTHPNCEAPYVISNEYYGFVENSTFGILIAKDNGKVVFNNQEIMVIYYNNLKTIKIYQIPLYKITAEIFSSQLRFALQQEATFKKDDIIYSYDCFRNGFPSYGYNLMTGYFNFFGYNFEDSMIISESFAKKAKSTYCEKVYVPIFEYTLLQPLFQNDSNSLIYFPNIGQQLDSNGLICSQLKTNDDENTSIADKKNKMMRLFNSLSVSDLINIHKNQNLTQFSVDYYKSKIKNGKLTGIKVHRLKSKKALIDQKLSNQLSLLFNNYVEHHIIPQYSELKMELGEAYARQVTKSHLIYYNDTKTTNRDLLKNAIYLLEFEVTKEIECFDGDKLCNRYAGKGVISLTLPDELRPVAMQSNLPIDNIFNSFGVFSRMNISQIVEGIVGKNVMRCEQAIKNDDVSRLQILNDDVIKNLNNDQYYNDVNELIKRINNNDSFKKRFIDNVKEHGLVIEAPSFSELNIKNIIKKSKDLRETIFIKKECLEYIKDKMKVDIPFSMRDIEIPNIFCAPIYTMRLHKIAKDVLTARDLGKYKFITKQPLKGKANEGGSRLGYLWLNVNFVNCWNILRTFNTTT